MPRAPKRLIEPRLQRELPPQVSDLIHARRDAGHPCKFTTKDVRTIIRYVSDKPEPARPSFFTEADLAHFNRTRRSARNYGERIAAERIKSKPSLADRIEKPRLAERIAAGTNAVRTTSSPIIDFKNKSRDNVIAIFIPKIRRTLRRLAILIKLERFELLPNDIRISVRNFINSLDKFYNDITTRSINPAQWQALNYGLIEIGKVSFKNLRQRYDEIVLEIARVAKGGYFDVLEA